MPFCADPVFGGENIPDKRAERIHPAASKCTCLPESIHGKDSALFRVTKQKTIYLLSELRRFWNGRASKKSSDFSPEDFFTHTNINNTNNVWLNSIVPVAKIIQNAYRRNPYFQVFRHREPLRTVSKSSTLPIRSHVGPQPESAEPAFRCFYLHHLKTKNLMYHQYIRFCFLLPSFSRPS